MANQISRQWGMTPTRRVQQTWNPSPGDYAFSREDVSNIGTSRRMSQTAWSNQVQARGDAPPATRPEFSGQRWGMPQPVAQSAQQPPGLGRPSTESDAFDTPGERFGPPAPTGDAWQRNLLPKAVDGAQFSNLDARPAVGSRWGTALDQRFQSQNALGPRALARREARMERRAARSGYGGYA